jgi:hypothetical protein
MKSLLTEYEATRSNNRELYGLISRILVSALEYRKMYKSKCSFDVTLNVNCNSSAEGSG